MTKRATKTKAKMGQPTKFNDDVAKKIKKLAKLGLTDVQLAAAVDVTERTINNWKNAHPNFFQSLKDGKSEADRKVEGSLFKAACGFKESTSREVVDKNGDVHSLMAEAYYPPNPTSMIFWLKNRQPDEWRDKIEIRKKTTHTLVIDDDGEEVEFDL